MAVTDQTLRIRFRNQAGRIVSISFDNPRDDLTAAEVEAAMDLLIARNTFTSTGGDLVAKYDATVTDRTITYLYAPPA
jgi:hypothetical protein